MEHGICRASRFSSLLIFNLTMFIPCFGLFLSEYLLSGDCGGESLESLEKGLYFHVYACK